MCPIVKLPFEPNVKAGVIVIKYAESYCVGVVSKVTSLKPFNDVAPPPPPACKVMLPVPEENVNTSPSDAPDCNPGILSEFTLVSPKVISLLTLLLEGSAL